jgi:mannose-6-phosphate isomerase-like protein (cupin superfamily)
MGTSHIHFSAWFIALATFTAAPALMAQAPSHAKADPAKRADKLAWAPAPPIFPAGAQMVVLQGDPAASAIVTVRLKLPNDYVIKPHWHPTDEHVTVIQGQLVIGMGDTGSPDAELPVLKVGDFVTAPAKMHHYARARGETVVQVHMMGPFQLTYVNPKDDPTQ